MIVFTASPAYFAPVTLKQLDSDGALQEVHFDAQFKRLKDSERKIITTQYEQWRQLILRRVFDSLIDGPVMEAQYIELLHKNMVGWRGVNTPNGEAVEFSLMALDELCEEHTGLLTAIVRSLHDSFNPDEAAHLAAKN